MRPHVLAVALALFAAPAGAQPPSEGSISQIAQPSILCDTSAQVQSIVNAFVRSPEQGAARFVQLFGTMNERQEPTCAVTVVAAALTAESIDLGKLDIDGEGVYVWIVHIRNDAGEGFYLHLESPRQALKNTI
jgi:hypothetical protein